jgi:ATP-dependent exoDNAse (exonuclease V) alpha subunit
MSYSVDIRFDPQLNKDVAERQQLPLQLAYALTIHKSQGMSLPNVSVDCQNIFAPGQLAVAIGKQNFMFM